MSAPDDPNTAAWQSDAQEFVAECEEAPWSDVGAKALAHLREKRGLVDETVRAWRLGYWHGDGKIGGWWRGRFVCRGIVIPWLVSGGAVWRVKIRRPLPGRVKSRYASFPGARPGPGLFGVDKLTGKPDRIVAEGEFDTMLLWQEVGDLADAFTLGAACAALDDRWLPALLSAVRFWIATDNDKRGAAAAKYWLDLVGERGKRVLPPGGAKDVGDARQVCAGLRAWAMEFLPLP